MSKSNDDESVIDENDLRYELITEDVGYSVNNKSRVQCFYCGKEYLITSIASHWQTFCREAIEKSGKSYENIKKKQDKKRRTKYEEDNHTYLQRLKINKKRWISELEKKRAKPKHHYLEKWLSLEYKKHFLFYDTTLQDIGQENFPINLREKLYSLLSDKLLQQCKKVLDFHFDYKNASVDDLKILQRLGDSFYRNFKKMLHPDQ